MSFLEDQSNVTAFVPNALIAEASAAVTSDYSKRFPKTTGDTLGILLSTATGTLNQPVQESGTGVDVVLTNTGYLAVFSKSDSVNGSGNVLFTNVYNRNIELINNNTLASLDPSLVGYWDMETLTSSGLLKDLSGNGNDGTCYNGTSSGSCGAV